MRLGMAMAVGGEIIPRGVDIYCSQACRCSSVGLSLSESLYPLFQPIYLLLWIERATFLFPGLDPFIETYDAIGIYKTSTI